MEYKCSRARAAEGMGFNIAVILSTYNQPKHLERALWGYAVQSRMNFELVVADDGSASATRALCERLRDEAGLELVHVWHEDRGFRKSEILNRAILATDADYLIFSDGDCIPRADFVEVHARLARPGRFLSGGMLKLSVELTNLITVDNVTSGLVTERRWLLRNGWKPGRRRPRLLRSSGLAGILDRLTPTGATFNGHNASTWRRHLLEVNGFDLDVGYGGQDRALGLRLENHGVRGVQVRYRAPVLHLAHDRPYQDEEVRESNRRIRERIRKNREVQARFGIAELGEGGVIRRY